MRQCVQNGGHCASEQDQAIHALVVAAVQGAVDCLLTGMFLQSVWTNSYFVSTVGGALLEVIKQYIKKQKLV